MKLRRPHYLLFAAMTVRSRLARMLRERMSTPDSRCAATAFSVCLAALAFAQSAAQPPAASQETSSVSRNSQGRESPLPRERAALLLKKALAIAPGEAQAFLELGETIADEAATSDAIELRSLAVQVLVTAHEHARVQSGGQAHATRVSSLLALSEIVPTRSDRDRVRSLAAMLDPAGAGALMNSQSLTTSGKGPQAQQSVDYLAALVLGSVRSGDGSRARQLLRRSDVRERLQSIDGLLSRAGIAGGMSRILEEASRWPCPVCGNTKVEKPSRAGGESRLCTHCQGIAGPKLSAQETLAWLRVESQLLHLDHANWAAQRALDGGEPLAIIDDENLPRWIGVQPLVQPFVQAPAPLSTSPEPSNAPSDAEETPELPPPPSGG